MPTQKSDDKTDTNLKQFRFSLDPSRKGLKGNFTQMDFPEGKTALLKEPIISIFTDSQLVSHESGKDFQIILGKSNIQSQESIAQLVVVLSFDNLVKFRKAINTQITEKSKDNSNVGLINESASVLSEVFIQAPMVYTDKTYYYSPSEFVFMSLGNIIRIYFGRLFGQVKFDLENSERRTSLFQFECIIESNQLISLSKAIETNILNFEKKYNVTLDEITKMTKILEEK